MANKRIGINIKPTETLDVAGNIKSSGTIKSDSDIDGVNIHSSGNIHSNGTIKSDSDIDGINVKGDALYINGIRTIWYE